MAAVAVVGWTLNSVHVGGEDISAPAVHYWTPFLCDLFCGTVVGAKLWLISLLPDSAVGLHPPWSCAGPRRVTAWGRLRGQAFLGIFWFSLNQLELHLAVLSLPGVGGDHYVGGTGFRAAVERVLYVCFTSSA